MIIDEVVLHNFGVYKGRHALTLTPKDKKPIILIGGLNGGGKTTLLDAFQLALYGKFAKCSNRGNKAYHDFLRDTINRSTDPKDGAAVEVEFRQVIEGEEYSFRVHRSWYDTGKTVSEHVGVSVGGKHDQVVTDSWYEVVEEFLPARLSHLFFFDGEKIEALADLAKASRLLKTAVHSLLGIDTVEQLSKDLVVLERRKRAENKDDFDKLEIENLSKTIRETEGQIGKLKQDASKLRADLDRSQHQFVDIEEKFVSAGGDLLDKRREVEAERKITKVKLDQALDNARTIAGGAAPLLLVQDLLRGVLAQAHKEEGAAQAQFISNVLLQRDKAIVQLLEKNKGTKKSLADLEDFLAQDRNSRMAQAQVVSYLHFSPESSKRLKHLCDEVLPEVAGQSQASVREIATINNQMDTLDRKLASVPDKDAVADIVEKRADALKKIAALENKIEFLESETDRQIVNYQMQQAKLNSVLEKKVSNDTHQDDLQRLVDHSQKTRKTLETFRLALVSQKVGQISQMILESFDQLTRKEKLLTDIKIDPATYAITIFGPDGKAMPAERLSAGERQLLAVSMLWGLARASGRPLPTVIDTPLGRLDSTHRTFLLERYFPFASHQVLLLSTDEEITSTYLGTIQQYIAHSYLLEHDDTLKSTIIKKGYFWN